MDVSGSMTKSKKFLARSFFFLLYQFLNHKYSSVDVVFVSHTTEANEVNEEQFNRINEIVFPSKANSKRDKAKNIREVVASQFKNERLGAFGENAWDVFNAFTAYNTHDRTSRETRGKTSAENAFNSQSDALYVRKVRKAIQEVLAV